MFEPLERHSPVTMLKHEMRRGKREGRCARGRRAARPCPTLKCKVGGASKHHRCGGPVGRAKTTVVHRGFSGARPGRLLRRLKKPVIHCGRDNPRQARPMGRPWFAVVLRLSSITQKNLSFTVVPGEDKVRECENHRDLPCFFWEPGAAYHMRGQRALFQPQDRVFSR